MALPILNDQPKYDLTIPSTNQNVRFRPYLVREEKVLMIAMESQDPQQMFSSILDTVKACVKDEVEWDNLAIFDIEYMFIAIRSKSVGETSKVNLKCESCGEQNEISIELTDIMPKMPDISNTIQLTDDISLEMQWPGFNDLYNIDLSNPSGTEMTMNMLGKCIKYVNTPDDKIIMSDESKESIANFIESLNTNQFELIKDYTENMPQINKDVEYCCVNCSHMNKIKLQGMSDFF